MELNYTTKYAIQNVGCSELRVSEVCVGIMTFGTEWGWGADQLKDSLGCLEFQLSGEHLQKLNELSNIEMGFPHDFLSSDGVRDNTFGGLYHNLDNHRK